MNECKSQTLVSFLLFNLSPNILLTITTLYTHSGTRLHLAECQTTRGLHFLSRDTKLGQRWSRRTAVADSQYMGSIAAGTLVVADSYNLFRRQTRIQSCQFDIGAGRIVIVVIVSSSSSWNVGEIGAGVNSQRCGAPLWQVSRRTK